MTFQLTRQFRTMAAVVVLAAGTLPGGAIAQEVSDSHLAAARSAISSLGATDPFDDILPATAEGLKGRLIANNPDLEVEIADIVDEQTLALVSRRADLEDEAARIYAAAFTEEELSAIASFYGTEAGQKLLQNGPIVAREVNGSVQIWARGVERDLLQNVVTKMNEAGLRANTTGAEGPAAEIPETPTTQN
jgi:uncharacterized protein